MKKLQSTWYNMVGVLTAIAVVAGAALAAVNDVTSGPIKLIKEKQLSDGIRSVLNAEELQVERTDTLQGGQIVIYQTSAGTAVQASDPNGFAGEIKVLVGFSAQGDIAGYKVLESNETPGLGEKAKDWFASGKSSIIGKNPSKELKVTKDGGDVDAITASTITSRAFLRCVNTAYNALQSQMDAQSSATVQSDK